MRVHQNFARLFFFLGLVVFFFTGCTGKTWQEFQMARDRENLEDNTPAFNPGYFKNQTNQHLALFFEIIEGQLTLSSRPAELRPGSLPHQNRSAGNVEIKYFDGTGEKLGQYAIEDPLIARSCDVEAGEIMGETKNIPSGTVEILLPDNLMITQIEVSPIKKKGIHFQVGEVIKASRVPSVKSQIRK